MKMQLLFCVLAGGLCVFNVANADNCEKFLAGKADFAKEDMCFYAGLGFAGFRSEYHEDIDGTIFPLLLLVSELFYWSDEEVGYYFLGDESSQGYWGTAMTLAYVEEGFEDSDNEPQLNGLDELNATIDLGLKFNVGGAWGDIEVHISQDVSDEHGGLRIRSAYSFPLIFVDLTIRPAASLTYSDEGRANYYYGVRAANATGARPVYKVADALSYSLGYDLTYPVSASWLLFHSLGFTVFDHNVSDSPLVVNDDSFFVAAGVYYAF